MVKIRSLLIREWVLFIGLVLVLLFSLWWWGFIRLVDAQAAAQATSSLFGLDREIQSHMELSEDLGSALAALWVRGRISPGLDPGTSAVVHALAVREREVSLIALVDAAGNGVIADRRLGAWTTSTLELRPDGQTQAQEYRWTDGGVPVPSGPPERIPADYRTRPWYRKVSRSKQASWTHPYQFQRLGQTGITYAIPVWSKSGEWLGAIGVDLLLEDLSREIWDIQPTKHSRVTITDDQGRALALPKISEFETLDSRRLAYLKPASPEFLPVVNQVDQRFRPGESEGRIRVNGERYFVSRRMFVRNPGVNWRIYLAIPDSDLLSGPRRQALWALALSLILVALVSWRLSFLADRLAGPLALLADGSQSIDLGVPLIPPETSIAEIKDLGDALEASTRVLQEKKQLEEQLRRSQRLEALGQMAGGIAHDVNNFLGAVLAQIQLAGSHASMEPAIKRHLIKAEETVTRCGEIMRSLLTFGKPAKPEVRRVDLNSLVNRAAELLDHARGKGIHVRLHLMEGMPPIWGDPVQLEQVIVNLGLNGRDAMPSGGTLTFSTGCLSDGQLFLRVSDTGTGMPPEVVERIFEPFFTTKDELGTGLGLSMVFAIVQAHGGLIEVDSQSGRGSVFTVRLPVVSGCPELTRTEEGG